MNRANKLLDTSLTRLSTGLKINSGKDNPSGLIASETLRTEITAIEQSINNSNRANNVLSTADSALGEINNLLNQIRGLVQEGLNDGALSQAETEANQLQIDAGLSAINRIAGNTTFGGEKLIDGSKAFVTQMTTADAAELNDFSVNEALFGSSSTIEVTANVSTAATKGQLIYAGGGLSAALTMEVSGADGSQVLFLGGSATVDDIHNSVNSVTDVTGVASTITTNAVVGTVNTTAASGVNGQLTLDDGRATQGNGSFSTRVNVNLVNSGTASSTLAVSSITLEANGDQTIAVNLGTTAGSVINSTGEQVRALLAGNAEVSALVTASNMGDGSAVVDADAVVIADGTDGTLTLESTNFGSAEFVDLNVLSGTFATTDPSTAAASRDAGSDLVATINGQAANSVGLKASVKTASLDASVTFTDAANAVGTSTVITITGGGSLFQIGQEVSAAGQIGLGIDAVNTARLGGVTGKLAELGTGGGKSLLDVGPSVQGSSLVNIIEESISRVSTLRGRLGSLQKNVIETNISTLGIALENISEARSQITDTDFAEETANLTRGQILSQSSIAVLSIANQNPSQVLSLLG
jgi:flagellin